jgi:hypothetical protein
MPEYVTMEVPGYKLGKTIEKYLIELAILLLITALAWVADSVIPELTIDYPEYAGILAILAPLIHALINWMKHRNDVATVRVDPATGIIINNE